MTVQLKELITSIDKKSKTEENPEELVQQSAPLSALIEGALVSAAALHPIASALAAGWSQYKNYREVERINDILKKFSSRLSELAADIDHEYLRSEEAKVLVEQVVMKGKSQLREEKRNLLAEYLVNSCTKSLCKDSEKEIILETLDKLTPIQVTVLVEIARVLATIHGESNLMIGSSYQSAPDPKPEFKYLFESQLVALFPGLPTNDAEASLTYMEAVGVLEDQSKRGWSRVGGRQGVTGYRPSKLGLKILQFLGISLLEKV